MAQSRVGTTTLIFLANLKYASGLLFIVLWNGPLIRILLVGWLLFFTFAAYSPKA